MRKKISNTREIKVGDLVYHLLHGKEWVGVLLEIIDVYKDESKGKNHRELGLVMMQPGTKYQNFFAKMVSKQNRVNDSLGFVSTNWLFKLEKKENIKEQS
jgi:hypothetical protein|tara:strand:- start:3239 stop:3538 length:300 start_codon:yes stop_codon:yes gene_type:complete